MATDYDAQRKGEDDTESIEVLKERMPDKPSGVSDGDDSELEPYSAPDVVNEELDVVVMPKQENEFTCMECFLLKPATQLGKKNRQGSICLDCSS